MSEMKSGAKSTEFWTTIVTVCTLLGAVLPAVIQYVPEGSVAYVIIGIVVSVAGAVGAYALSRGGVKKEALKAATLAGMVKPPADPQ